MKERGQKRKKTGGAGAREKCIEVVGWGVMGDEPGVDDTREAAPLAGRKRACIHTRRERGRVERRAKERESSKNAIECFQLIINALVSARLDIYNRYGELFAPHTAITAARVEAVTLRLFRVAIYIVSARFLVAACVCALI